MPHSIQFGNLKVENADSRRLSGASYKLNWVIQNFQNCSSQVEVGEYDESPHFFFGTNNKYNWSLDIYLAGLNQHTHDFIGIRAFLFDGARYKGKYFVVKISILDKDGKNRPAKIAKVKGSSGTISQFISRDDLLNNTDLLPNDELRIVCEIFDLSKVDTRLDEDVNKVHLLRYSPLEKFLGNDKFSDFKFTVKEKEFCVHRAILASFSPVFEAMFDSKMREASEGEAHIDGIEPNVMEKLLHFIYTGIIDAQELADKLLVAAEKYQIDELKQQCENELIKQLNLKNVYDILLIADQNNAVNLKEQAMKFFDKNLKMLTKEDDFKASVDSLPRNVLADIIYAYALNR